MDLRWARSTLVVTPAAAPVCAMSGQSRRRRRRQKDPKAFETSAKTPEARLSLDPTNTLAKPEVTALLALEIDRWRQGGQALERAAHSREHPAGATRLCELSSRRCPRGLVVND
jgi:hypothetical protein